MKGQNRSFFLESHLSYIYSTFIFMYHEMAEILPLGHKTVVQPINQWDIPRGRDEFCARVKHTEILSKWHEKQHRITQGIGLHRFRIRLVILYYWHLVVSLCVDVDDNDQLNLYSISEHGKQTKINSLSIVLVKFLLFAVCLKKRLWEDSFISFNKITN